MNINPHEFFNWASEIPKWGMLPKYYNEQFSNMSLVADDMTVED